VHKAYGWSGKDSMAAAYSPPQRSAHCRIRHVKWRIIQPLIAVSFDIKCKKPSSFDVVDLLSTSENLRAEFPHVILRQTKEELTNQIEIQPQGLENSFDY
jgi:hypothetical protein